MMTIGLIILYIISMVVLFGYYFWLERCYQFWKSRRVPYTEPESIAHGHYGDFIEGKLSSAENAVKVYNALAPHKFGGIFVRREPVLFVRDPEIIKHILVENFFHFCDRSASLLAVKGDPLSSNLFNLTGDDWRILKYKLLTTFTSDKMKLMFRLMKNCVEKLESIIEERVTAQEAIEMKDLMNRYTTDVTSLCAFGLEVDSLDNPNSEFRTMVKLVLTPSLRSYLRNALLLISPKFVKFIKFTAFPRRVNDFFVNLVRDTIDYRTRNGIVRNDYLDQMMNVEKMVAFLQDFDFTFEPLVSHCFVFVRGGIETPATVLAFILYELAEHQDVQSKLQDEVDSTLTEYGGEITYDALKDMDYLKKVFNDYRLPNSNYVMREGETVFIPIHALHRDPQYFPDPDVFNPEHFSEEAKASRPAYCFLPFSDGPRNCIGQKFGTLEVKLAVAAIMRKYTVSVSPKMKLPLELMPHSAPTVSKNDILLDFNRRDG